MLTEGYWYGTSKFDPRVVRLYARHYSSAKNKKTVVDWLKHGIAAPGEIVVLLTADASALFVWLKQKFTDSEQVGVNCAVFRNESKLLSSALILEAENFAWSKWPGERLFTYVDGEKTARRRGKKNSPGHCFLMAGWKECGKTKRGLVILEKYANIP